MMQGPGGLLGPLFAQLGPDVLRTNAADFTARLTDHRGLFTGRALALALPRSAEEVATILAFCHVRRIGVVPQGGNTSYCGGATPDETGSQLLLALDRMTRVRSVDAVGGAMVAEAGCTLASLQQAARDADRLFPLTLGSQGSCQLGGNLSTNAGGLDVLRYGMARDLVLGLELVLADGRVMSNLGTLRKDNTGYDLRHLFLGAEGTLGVITAASLKLFPAPRQTVTALVACASVAAAVTLLDHLRAASSDRLSSFELIPANALDLVLQHIPGTVRPLPAGSPFFALLEITSSNSDEPLREAIESALGLALESKLITDAVLAQNSRERDGLWKLRESIPEAQRRDGASLKHDVALPIARLPQFYAVASAWVREHVPEGVLVAYGHVGDGNLHFNINQRPGTARAAFLAREPEVKRAIHDLVRDHAGSFSAEHGIGRLKVEELERYAGPVELDLMRTIKRSLDPHGIMNPGKVLRRAP